MLVTPNSLTVIKLGPCCVYRVLRDSRLLCVFGGSRTLYPLVFALHVCNSFCNLFAITGVGVYGNAWRGIISAMHRW